MCAFQVPFTFESTESTPLLSSICLDTDPRFTWCVKQWSKQPSYSLDIETYGEDSFDKGGGLNPWRGNIRLIQIGLRDGLTLVVDLGRHSGPKEPPVHFMEVLQQTLNDPTKLKVGMNFKFDLLWLKKHFGFDARNVADIMHASQLLWAGKERSHSLKAICGRLGIEVDKSEQRSNWAWELSNEQINYAARDAQATLEAYHALLPMLAKERLTDAFENECGALPVFVEMEYHGMPADYGIIKSVLKEYMTCADVVRKPFDTKFRKVNPDSPAQVKKAVSAVMGIDLPSTDADTIAQFREFPELRALSLYRTVKTCIEYVAKCQAILDYYGDGVVRTTYRQLAPKGFGRSTSGEDRGVRMGANLQNPPSTLPEDLWQYELPAVRSFFKAPPGRALLVADLSQAHLRIAVDASQDPQLLKVYKLNLDAHCVTAASLAKQKGYGPEWTPEAIKKWTKDPEHPNHTEAKQLRKIAKPVMYGSLNGQGPVTLRKTSETQGVKMSEDESIKAVAAWREAYQGLYKFQKKIVSDANQRALNLRGKDYGIVRGHSGRIVALEKFTSTFAPERDPSVKMSDACAFYWTSTEADIIKHAMGLFVKQRDKHPEWQALVRNMVHDELDVTCAEEHKEAVARTLQMAMHTAMRRYIQTIPVDDPNPNPLGAIVSSWADK